MTNNTTYTTQIGQDIGRAATYIQSGHCIAFGTETVYGLGADARDDDAVAKIFATKKRPSDNPLIVHFSSIEMIQQYVDYIDELSLLLFSTFSPGPLTVILPQPKYLSDKVSRHGVGCRIPDHQVARDFLDVAGCPIAAPSANISGRPSPTTAQMVYDDLGGRIPYILDTGPCEGGIESTVVKVLGKSVLILRPGLITVEDIQDVVPPDVTVSYHYDAEHESPGTRYKHYSPSCYIQLFDERSLLSIPNDPTVAIMAPTETITQCRDRDNLLLDRGSSMSVHAHRLYDLYIQADRANCQTLFVQRLPEEGLGYAVMNRVYRSLG